MGKTIINNYEEFEAFLGKEIGVSEYVQISQEQIDKFADATLDYQWIHTNPERAAKESPFKSTIAHGYLSCVDVNLFVVQYCRSAECENDCELRN